MTRPIKIIAFYTVDTPYQKLARRFKRNMNKYGLDHHIYPMENKGKWVFNCGLKPNVLFNALNDFPDHDLLYLDIDAKFLRKPKFLDFKNKQELGFCFWKSSPFRKNSLLSGTMFFPNNQSSRELLTEWIKVQSENPYKWDQRNLQKIVKQYPYFTIKLKWCYIKKYMKVKNPIVLQTQASRKLKPKIKQNK